MHLSRQKKHKQQAWYKIPRNSSKVLNTIKLINNTYVVMKEFGTFWCSVFSLFLVLLAISVIALFLASPILIMVCIASDMSSSMVSMLSFSDFFTLPARSLSSLSTLLIFSKCIRSPSIFSCACSFWASLYSVRSITSWPKMKNIKDYRNKILNG